MCSFFFTSADVNFALELSDLRHRHGFRIILVHKNQASEALLHHAHELICFEEFISDLPPRLPLKMPVRFQILNSLNVPKCQSPLSLILEESSAILWWDIMSTTNLAIVYILVTAVYVCAFCIETERMK